MARLHSRPTQTDVAREAGVSTAVVSLVINGRANGKVRISAETQARVWDAVRAQGYVPNLAARQLAGGRNAILGVFTYEPIFPLTPTSFYHPFLMGIEEAAELLGYDLLLFTRPADENGRRTIYQNGVARLRKADGALLLGTNEDRSELARLAQEDYPFVFVGRREIDGVALPSVNADYASATEGIVRHLLDLGHREILYLGPRHSNESAEDRMTGFRRSLATAGIPWRDDRLQLLERDEVTPTWLEAQLARGVTAITSHTMHNAVRLLECVRELGLSVPRDVSVASLGDTDGPPIDMSEMTTFLIPRRAMGVHAVRMLVEMLEAPGETTNVDAPLSCVFVPGETTGPPPAGVRSGALPVV